MTATAPAAPAKVYFTNLRTHARESQLDKLKRLIRHAGIEQIDFENKFVAIKIHFGELGNLSFLRPNYARAVADVVKELGGKPFLTDCNTLYVGSRKNALEHIDTAYQNGFTPYATGCQIIIADGLKGTDEALVPVEGGEYVREAKIGQALMDADIVISLTHFKGHEQAGFGGAMKNLGMGGGSRAGKMEQHAAGKPNVATEHCVGCRACEKICAHNAISFDDTRERELVNGNTRTVHVAAIDQACADAVMASEPLPNTELTDSAAKMEHNHEHLEGEQAKDPFCITHPDTDWRACIAHAEKIGLGTSEYELIEVK